MTDAAGKKKKKKKKSCRSRQFPYDTYLDPVLSHVKRSWTLATRLPVDPGNTGDPELGGPLKLRADGSRRLVVAHDLVEHPGRLRRIRRDYRSGKVAFTWESSLSAYKRRNACHRSETVTTFEVPAMNGKSASYLEITRK